VQYFEAYWLLHELVWSGARMRAGGIADDDIAHRWLLPETIDRGVAEFQTATGIRLEPLKSA